MKIKSWNAIVYLQSRLAQFVAIDIDLISIFILTELRHEKKKKSIFNSLQNRLQNFALFFYLM